MRKPIAQGPAVKPVSSVGDALLAKATCVLVQPSQTAQKQPGQPGTLVHRPKKGMHLPTDSGILLLETWSRQWAKA